MVTKAEEVLQVLAESTQETAKQMASMQPSDPNYEKIVKANGIVSKQYNDLLKTMATMEKDKALIELENKKHTLDEQRAQNELLIENRKLDIEANKVQVSTISDMKNRRCNLITTGVTLGARTLLVAGSIVGLNSGHLMKLTDTNINTPLDRI